MRKYKWTTDQISLENKNSILPTAIGSVDTDMGCPSIPSSRTGVYIATSLYPTSSTLASYILPVSPAKEQTVMS